MTLINDFPSDPAAKPFDAKSPFRYGNPFNDLPRSPAIRDDRVTIGRLMKISQQVGLHPQLVAFDVTKANGINVGFNPTSTVGPRQSRWIITGMPVKSCRKTERRS